MKKKIFIVILLLILGSFAIALPTTCGGDYYYLQYGNMMKKIGGTGNGIYLSQNVVSSTGNEKCCGNSFYWIEVGNIRKSNSGSSSAYYQSANSGADLCALRCCSGDAYWNEVGNMRKSPVGSTTAYYPGLYGSTANLKCCSNNAGEAPYVGNWKKSNYRSSTSSWIYGSATCSNEPTYSYSCTLPSCSLPWGGTLAHGSSVTAYSSSSVACGSSCSSQTRTCNSGALSGSYTKESCVVQACNSCASPVPSVQSGKWVRVGSPSSVSQSWVFNSSVSATGSCSWGCSSGYVRSGSGCVVIPNSCASPVPSVQSGKWVRVGSPSSVSQSWVFNSSVSATGSCSWGCDNGYIQDGANCQLNVINRGCSVGDISEIFTWDVASKKAFQCDAIGTFYPPNSVTSGGTTTDTLRISNQAYVGVGESVLVKVIAPQKYKNCELTSVGAGFYMQNNDGSAFLKGHNFNSVAEINSNNIKEYNSGFTSINCYSSTIMDFVDGRDGVDRVHYNSNTGGRNCRGDFKTEYLNSTDGKFSFMIKDYFDGSGVSSIGMNKLEFYYIKGDEVCDGIDNDCDDVVDNGTDMECVFGDAGCDNTTCKLIVGEELTCETSLGSDVNKITLLEVEAKDNELVATISCSNNLVQVGFSLMDFGANSLGDVNVFDESGVKQDGLVDCNICPIKYVLQNDLLEFNETYLVNTGGGVTCGDCEESAYVYYGKTSDVAIPDNNIVLVILIISIVAFISTKKRI
jgi:hypothetical protein